MSAQLIPESPRFRAVQRQDLGNIMRIEKRAYDYPWSKGVFKDCLSTGYRCRLMEYHDRPVGYGVLSVALDEAHLLNLCVDPDWQGQGLAGHLLRHMSEQASAAGASSLFLEVRPSNAVALHLYRRFGFCEVGTRRGYYPALGGREDALIMALALLNESVASWPPHA